METAKISCHVDALKNLKMVVNGSTNSTPFKWLPAKMAKRNGVLGPNICGEWMLSMNQKTVFISATEEVWLDHSKNTEHRSMIYSHSASTPWFKERLLVPKAPKNPTCFVTKSPRNCLPNRHIEKNFSSAASDSTKLRWLLGTTKRPDLAVDGCR